MLFGDANGTVRDNERGSILDYCQCVSLPGENFFVSALESQELTTARKRESARES